jgi:hypothetical protein
METTPSVPDELLFSARRYICTLGIQYQDPQSVLYDDRLALFLEQRVAEFGNTEQTDATTVRIARLAALFYPFGYLIDRRSPLAAAQASSAAFLQQQGEAKLADQVQKCLQATYRGIPVEVPARLLMDARAGIYLNDGIHNWADLRTLEYDLRNGPQTLQAQAELQLQELLNLRFHTSAGKTHWQHLLAQQILAQRKKLEKIRRNQAESLPAVSDQPFGQIEASVPARGVQTYFRAVYRNHINLSAIADNKANIMISVNSILISVLITFLSYRNIAETQPMVLLPVVIFLVTGLASLVCAVLSARPKVTQLKKKDQGVPSGLAFFGNFVHLPLEKFTAAMDETLQSSNLLYYTMVEDLYHLGKVLDKKYRYLSVSYNIFMVGLIVTVLLFLITLF